MAKLAQIALVTTTNATKTHAVRKPLDDAERELMCARGVVDAMHDVFSCGDEALKEGIVSASLPCVLYDVVLRLRAIEEHVQAAITALAQAEVPHG